MPALLTAAELSVLAGQPVSEAQFNTIYNTALRLVRREYRADPEVATSYTRDVLADVVTACAVRILSNPTGARSIGLGSANITFGGQDEDITSAFTLTPAERASIRGLRGTRIYSAPLLLPGET